MKVQPNPCCIKYGKNLIKKTFKHVLFECRLEFSENFQYGVLEAVHMR